MMSGMYVNNVAARSSPESCAISSKMPVILPFLFQWREHSAMQISKKDIQGIASDVCYLLKGLLCKLRYFDSISKKLPLNCNDDNDDSYHLLWTIFYIQSTTPKIMYKYRCIVIFYIDLLNP